MLFSAYAEVFPTSHGWMTAKCPFLCLRRGVSGSERNDHADDPFSLPTQRCFQIRNTYMFPLSLFSAYAEVFPVYASGTGRGLSFLCLRRGVSSAMPKGGGAVQLFSAYAEVFPR